MNLRRLRLRAVWLLILPFLVLSTPTMALLTVGVLLALPGVALRAWSAGTIHKDHELTMSGPYAYLRNPLYLGSFALGLGVSIAGGHWIWPVLFVAFFAAVYSRTMAHEAELLGGLFPEAFPEYRSEVPALIPRLTPYRPSGQRAPGGFRWAQYRRHKEWEAALGAVAAFVFLAVKALLR